jgi:hypothetical protein
MTRLAHDIRFAARLLLKHRAFTAAAVASLALGIGAATTVFTVIYSMSLRALPFTAPRRIVTVLGADADGNRYDPPYELFREWQDGRTGFSGLAAWRNASMNLADDDRAPNRFSGTFLTANAFSLLGEEPLLGRGFHPEDDRPGAQAVVLLGHGPWADLVCRLQGRVHVRRPAVLLPADHHGLCQPVSGQLRSPDEHPRSVRTCGV